MVKCGCFCGFDCEQVLCWVFDVFWEVGYEGVIMVVLKEVMGGICVLSMYVVYGFKEVLFCLVVEFYLSQECQFFKGVFVLLMVCELIVVLLESVVVSYIMEGKLCGCLVDFSMINFLLVNKGVEDYLCDYWWCVVCLLCECFV